MSWQQLKCQTTAIHQETIVDLMEAADAVSITWQDAEDDPILEPRPGEMRLWDNLIITALYEQDNDLSALLRQLADYEAQGYIQSLLVETVEDQAWERVWMDNFQPMCFGKRLWIYPSWYELPDDASVKLILDPGLAFGTGTHPTTALCLEWLDSQNLTGKCVLDFGCGSGILAIAALKLGACHAVGTDIDPQALQASLDNAQRNHIKTEQLALYYPEKLPNNTYDIVIANILAGPLVELAPQLLAYLRPGGQLILSGILTEQALAIQAAYQNHLLNFSMVAKENWLRVTGNGH